MPNLKKQKRIRTNNKRSSGQHEHLVRQRPTLMDAPIKYRLVASEDYKYNAGCTRCYDCYSPLGYGFAKEKTLCGFAEYENGLMQVHECATCGAKQRFHVRTFECLETLTRLLDIVGVA